MLQTPPTAHDLPVPRWSLALLQAQPPFHGLTSVSGVCRRLHKWRFPRKRSRDYLHSPDPAYGPKMLAIAAARLQAALAPQTHVVLYADEFTFYRQPERGDAYGPAGSGGTCQPRARRSTRSNTYRRIIAAVDAETGRVVSYQCTHVRHDKLVRFLRLVRAAYGPTMAITLIWDNWPNHYLDAVRAAAQQAEITLLPLPTYAPWTNPIEKLWDWLKEQVLRLHPWSDAWTTLRQRVTEWLAQFAHGSRALLRYIGLLPEAEDAAVWV